MGNQGNTGISKDKLPCYYNTESESEPTSACLARFISGFVCNVCAYEQHCFI